MRDWKHKIWKYVTFAVVILIALNPELLHLGLFIDTLGLEVFLLLVEVQVIVWLGVFLDEAAKPLLVCTKRLVMRYRQVFIRENTLEKSFSLSSVLSTAVSMVVSSALSSVASAPAILMVVLVFSAAVGNAFNVV